MGLTALLLLADGRLPAGGYAHSGGLEAAVAAGRVRDLGELRDFLAGRLHTAGLVAAAFAAAALARAGDRAGLSELDGELDARTPAPALRRASRAQGRALVRAGRAMWRLPVEPVDPHHAVALGVVCAAAGLDASGAAAVAAHASVAGPASAGVRLLGLDPYGVQTLLAELAPQCDRLAGRATALAAGPVEALPAAGAPLLDIGAEDHATWEVRLFAS
jgi:urease accessory protein